MRRFLRSTLSLTLAMLVMTVTILASDIISQGSIAHASGNGTWHSTGSLLIPRINAQAITLQNGNVLLMGGHTPGDVNDNESEIYDPATGTWHATGTMPDSIPDPTAVLLQNGKVLVVGYYFNDTELYDPGTGTWSHPSYTANSHAIGSTATLLPSGKVLVAGGGDANQTDIYDPSTNHFSFGGNMTTYRGGHIAVLLQNGKVLLAGGNGCTCGDSRGAETTATAELYDPSNGSFTPTGSMSVPRSGAAAALLSDGRVLVAGGSLNPARYTGSLDPTTTAEIYDPTTGTWSMTGNLHTSRSGLGPLRLLPNGNLLIIGGDSSGTSEEYNPASGTWSTPVSFLQPQCSGATALLTDGRVLLAAGNDCTSSGNNLVTSELYVNNVPPVVNPIPGATINEGATYSAPSTFTDTDSTSWTATVDYGDGSGVQPLPLSGMNFSLSHQYTDEGAYTVTVTVTDDQGATGTGTATVTVNEVTPAPGAITVSNPVVQINNSITASATFIDPVVDTHIATWNWGDGSTSNGTVTEPSGSNPGSVGPDSHAYTTAGVYIITLKVQDDDGVSNTSTYQYVSAYNPTAQGLFTAGQKYTSPAGAYLQTPGLTGTVMFGLSYRYQGTVPTGDRQFIMNFKAANLSFSATSVSALVISNSMATLTGTGTINGSGTYNFLVTGVNGGGIRIQITDPTNNNKVIYDTQPGNPATATPTTSVTGNVIVH